MRVERDKRLRSSFQSRDSQYLTDIKKSSAGSFDQELNQQSQRQIQERMNEILNQIDSLNKQLRNNLTISNLVLYSNLIKKFLKEASLRAYQLKQERGLNRRGRLMLITINKIDFEVEQMVNDFVDSQREPFEILAIIDKIRGMLVDLVA
ncbi:hypothetical protein ASZ90_017619 [hydrocarbon metagenome]|uniref:DUF327 domain-containing protein n=1 Tax=hydrocarbon metagenome TaxID=938273 RepID=A0A0W8E8S8_9ZZZZ